MKNTGITRPVDDLGRVVIPKELRKLLNINNRDLLSIHLEGDMIILKKNEDKCVLCGAVDELTLFGDKFVCAGCIEGLKNI